jgi:hypothetical protein
MNNISSPIQYFTKDHAVSMSLRDYFAAQAMQAFIDPNQWQSTVGEISSEVAFNAYALADAMMKAREA